MQRPFATIWVADGQLHGRIQDATGSVIGAESVDISGPTYNFAHRFISRHGWVAAGHVTIVDAALFWELEPTFAAA
jgi:hypothetical protein